MDRNLFDRKIMVASTAAVAVVLMPAVARAGPSAGGPTNPHSTVVADWQMNQPAGAGVMIDSAGHHDGTIGSGITTGGGVYQFSGKGEVSVPDAPGLDPGMHSFEITARVAVAPKNRSDYAIVQKGLYHQGGQWKMQVTWNVAICTFGESTVNGPVLKGGLFHTIECVRNPTNIQVIVDGRTVTKQGTVGNLTNSFPVTVGGKPPNRQNSNDYFVGQMDYVTLQTF